MTNRTNSRDAFLRQIGWQDATRAPLAGDASNRRYERLTKPDGTRAVLMDASPDMGEDVRPFVKIARHLSATGLSAPVILGEDQDHGFLLLEDLGDDLFARVLERDPSSEVALYSAAVDVLVALHRAPTPTDLKVYDSELMAEMAKLAYNWYLRGCNQPHVDAAARFQPAFQAVLQSHCPETNVLIQRDYHAENLLWLPDRSGPARVGLLDFQDAMLGHPAYDLVSLLQDARRDVAPDTEVAMIEHYLAAAELPREAFRAAYHVLGTQRNLRILGVFSRLSMLYGKPHYVDFIPRVWDLLQRDLDHPALAPVASMIRSDLPPPTLELLQLLREKCATVPMP